MYSGIELFDQNSKMMAAQFGNSSWTTWWSANLASLNPGLVCLWYNAIPAKLHICTKRKVSMSQHDGWAYWLKPLLAETSFHNYIFQRKNITFLIFVQKFFIHLRSESVHTWRTSEINILFFLTGKNQLLSKHLGKSDMLTAEKVIAI